jgi:hypothetical protein
MEGVNNIGIHWEKFERGKIKNTDNLKHIKNGYYEKRIEKVNCGTGRNLFKPMRAARAIEPKTPDAITSGNAAAVNNWREAAGF